MRLTEGTLIVSGGCVPSAKSFGQQLELKTPKPELRRGSGAKEPAILKFEIVSPPIRSTYGEQEKYLPRKRDPPEYEESMVRNTAPISFWFPEQHGDGGVVVGERSNRFRSASTEAATSSCHLPPKHDQRADHHRTRYDSALW